ncbi:MAG: DUF6502 family protein [Steroidobacteraceae bacterium]
MTRGRTKPRASRYDPIELKRDGPNDSVDAVLDEAMQRFVRVLVRRGASRATVQRAFRRAWLGIPRRIAEQERRAARDLIDVSHVLTLWFGDPFYVDARGDPLPLPLRGPAPSLASLVRHIAPTLNATKVLKCLMRVDAVRRIGSRYAPRSRAVALRGTGAPLHTWNLRALLGMLRTLEHNTEPKDKVPSWFEYVAENPRFPASAREPFDARFREDAMTFLRNQDSRMLNHERKADAGEPTVRMGVGVYRFEEEVSPGSATTPRMKRPRLRVNPKRRQRRGR